MVYTFFIGLWLCLLSTPQNAQLDDTLQIKEVESDDDKLNQALILVEILKTEYVKLLRQNILLRNGDETAIDVVEQPTCAPNATEAPDAAPGATHLANGNQTSEFSADGNVTVPPATPPAPAQAVPLRPNKTKLGVMAYYDMPMPTQHPYPLYQKQYQAPPRYFRRRIPDYYYYDIPRRRFYNEPPVVGRAAGLERGNKIAPYYRKSLPRGSELRRFDYDNDPFNDKPTTDLTTPTTVPSTTASATAVSTAAETASQTITSNVQESPDTTTATTPAQQVVTTSTVETNPPATPSSGKPTTTAPTPTATATRRSVRTTASTISAELDLEQLKNKKHHTPSLLTTKDPVDAEVASELVNELKEEGIPVKKLKGTSSTKTNPTTDIFDPAFKTSMRIFLEKSTRYPIPLPENHAFCYTNPNNPLCRTLIK